MCDGECYNSITNDCCAGKIRVRINEACCCFNDDCTKGEIRAKIYEKCCENSVKSFYQDCWRKEYHPSSWNYTYKFNIGLHTSQSLLLTSIIFFRITFCCWMYFCILFLRINTILWELMWTCYMSIFCYHLERHRQVKNHNFYFSSLVNMSIN